MLKKTFEKEPHMLRETFCGTLVEMAGADARIVALDADLMSSSGMKPFKKAFPERFINCGVAEANMVGVAAGLASMGFIPFAHSFGTFATRRVCDQVFMSCAYARLPVKIVGTDPGVCAAYNGGTHMPLEDMAVLRAIPEIVLVEPTDTVQLKNLMPQIAALDATVYIRLLRKNAVAVFEEGAAFEIGKAATLREGKDVTLVCSGIMVAVALEAADMLAKADIDARVVNMFTWKPVDGEALEKCAGETGAIVTCENHNVVGGLGSACAEHLMKTRPVPLETVGVQDHFGEVGPEDYLRGKFGLSAADVAAAAKRAVARKG
ncbi:MAG: transketolase family protein [Oscillospiraceae bacterium]|jgi:transketolase|nr:transketolase family protein [Oscillospiraceae bacterium]